MKKLFKQIIKERKKDELVRLNAVDIVDQIFSELQDRERDILSRRFALGWDDSQTLEEIGKLHNLTRERVRQIEKATLEKIKKMDGLDERLMTVRSVVEKILDEHGGAMEREFLLNVLSVLTLQISEENSDYEKKDYKNYFDFILSNLLNDYIDKVDDHGVFNSFYKIKDRTLDYFEDLVNELREKMFSLKRTAKFDEVVEMIKGSKTFNANKDKIVREEEDDLDLTDVFKSKIFPEKAADINKNKPFYSLLQAIKDVKRNKFGGWGHDSWPEVKPRRISDKIYLVLREENKPMHFSDIAKKINEIAFDHKKANVGSVHNELILDDRYVLFDRGVYGLKEWRK